MLTRVLVVFLVCWMGWGSILTLHGQDQFSVEQKRTRFLIDFSYQFVAQNTDATSRFELQMDSLQKVASQEKDKRALAYLQILRLRLQEITTNLDKKKSVLNEKIDDVFNTTSYEDLKAYILFFRGLAAFEKKDYVVGLPLLFKARKLLEETYFGKFPHSIYYYIGFFNIYYFFEDYKMAAFHCEDALKEPPNAVFTPMGIYNNLGLCYLKLKEYDKAEKAFKDGIKAAKAQKHINFEVLVRGNLGNLLRLKGEYKRALPYLYEEAKVNEKIIPENAAISRMYIANALIMLDSVQKAKAFLAPPAIKMPVWTYPTYDLIRFETQGRYYTKIGDFGKASRYKDSLLVLKDTLKLQLDYKKVVVLESRLQADKYINERKALQVQVANERSLRNWVIGGLAAIFLGIVYWLNTRRKEEKRIHVEERRKAEEMLAHANKQLAQFLSNIKEKNELIEKITAQIEEDDKPTIDQTEFANVLRSLQKSVLLTDEQWTDFKELFEQVFPSFFSNLTKKYPDLTAAEERIVALEKLNLTDRLKGNMLGISADSVKKTRYRLRKKYPNLMEVPSVSQVQEEGNV